MKTPTWLDERGQPRPKRPARYGRGVAVRLVEPSGPGISLGAATLAFRVDASGVETPVFWLSL